MSVAKKAVDSTIRRILKYTAEIILSIILLVVICIPLGFVVPMWLQAFLLGRPRTELALDPVRWFGLDGATWLTILLGFVSFVLGYVFILRLKPGITAEAADQETLEEDVEEEELEELDIEELEEVAEDIEEDEEEEIEEVIEDESDNEPFEDVVNDIDEEE